MTASPGASPLADAIVAAAQWARRLFPDNGWCASEDERVGYLARTALHDPDVSDGVRPVLGWTYVVLNGIRIVEADAATTAKDVAAMARALVPTLTGCDYCSGPPGSVAGLLPIPAGAVVTVLVLCPGCTAFVRGCFPSAYFIPLTGELS